MTNKTNHGTPLISNIEEQRYLDRNGPSLFDLGYFKPKPDGSRPLISVPRNVLFPRKQPPIIPQVSTVHWKGKK